MTIDELLARKQEIRSSLEGDTSGLDIKALTEEVRGINEQIETIKAEAAAAAELRKAVAEGEIGNTIKPVIEERKEVKTMNIVELRNSAEYGKAYLKAIKGDDSEIRSLLSDNAVGGQIPVPTMLETEIKNAWENYGVMSLVKKSYFAGNVKVGFELTATGAVVHAEGAAAPEEEVLTIGVVELKAENIKKWITVSDEAIEGTTVDTIGYLYKEIAQKIVEKAEEIMIGKITAAPTASNATAPAVAELGGHTLAIDTIVTALAMLSAQARDIHILMNRQTYAAVKATSLNNKWGADPFDGLKDRVVFTDKLKAYSAATSGDTYMIAGDFAYGAQANFPNGNDITIKVDDLSLSEKDLVKVVGRQYVGMAVVAPNAFVRVTK